MVDLGADIWIWKELEWRALTLLYNLQGRVLLEDGRYVVDELVISRRKGAPPITTEALRAVPVAQIVRDGLHDNFRSMMEGVGLRPAQNPPGTLAEAVRTGTDEGLQLVAAIYRLAYAFGYSPTAGLAEAFRTSRATAGRWIAAARERGFLGPAVGTKAGEAQNEGGEG